MPASASAGRISSENSLDCQATSSLAAAAMADSCSAGVSPLGRVAPTPAANWSLSPATRTWKNSSWLPLKIATNLARSSSGTAGSAAWASTRELNSRYESSRLM